MEDGKGKEKQTEKGKAVELSRVTFIEEKLTSANGVGVKRQQKDTE